MDPIRQEFKKYESAIADQLRGYAAVPQTKWFREVVFCILTPQSSPFHAELALNELEQRGFFDFHLSEKQITEVLRTPHRYVRFHHQKTKRLLQSLVMQPLVERMLSRGLPPKTERLQLISLLPGLGWKEASHALRNIGRSGLTILDRHILRSLQEYQVISTLPKSLSDRNYLNIETKFEEFAAEVDISIDALDLFFWFKETGTIFK